MLLAHFNLANSKQVLLRLLPIACGFLLAIVVQPCPYGSNNTSSPEVELSSEILSSGHANRLGLNILDTPRCSSDSECNACCGPQGSGCCKDSTCGCRLEPGGICSLPLMHLAATAPTDLDAVGLGGTYTVALAQEVYAGKPDWDPSVDTAVPPRAEVDINGQLCLAVRSQHPQTGVWAVGRACATGNELKKMLAKKILKKMDVRMVLDILDDQLLDKLLLERQLRKQASNITTV